MTLNEEKKVNDISVLNKKSRLIEWSAALFGIFWGIWWDKIADVILVREANIPLGTITLPSQGVILVIIVYISLFAYSFVKWMWDLRYHDWEVGLLTFLKISWRMILLVVGLNTTVRYLYNINEVTFSLYKYGITLTIAWLLVTNILAFQSDNWF